MKVISESINELMKRVDQAVETMLAKLQNQQKEIDELNIQNRQLKDLNQKTLEQIKEYIVELEQIKSHYVNSNNKIK